MSEAKRLAPGAKRNLLIIGGVLAAALLGLFAMVLMRTQATSPSGPAASVVVPPGVGAATGQKKDEPPSQALQALMRERQEVEADRARRAGLSYIPPDSAGTESVQVASPAPVPVQAMPAPMAAIAAGQVGMAAAPDEQARLERLRRGMQAQLADLMASAAPPRMPVRIQGLAQADAAPPAAAPPAGGTARAARAAMPPVVDALEIFAATTLTAVDTYQTNYISARIVSGRLAGAFLTGRTQLVNEGLQPRFTAMRLNGKTYAIDAIALDEQSGTDAVRADLDRRYMQRYVMPVVVAALGGYTAAKAQTGTVAVGLGDGLSTGITQPAPTEAQAINAGVASAMTLTQRAVERDAALPMRASLPAGTAIGVMFNAPVTEVATEADAFAGPGTSGLPSRARAGAVQDATATPVARVVPGVEPQTVSANPMPQLATPGINPAMNPSISRIEGDYRR